MSTNKVALLSLSLTLFFVTELRYFGIINIWTNIFILPKNARSVDSSIKSFAWSYCNFRSKSVKLSIYCKTKLAKFVMKYFENENKFDDFDNISQFWPDQQCGFVESGEYDISALHLAALHGHTDTVERLVIKLIFNLHFCYFTPTYNKQGVPKKVTFKMLLDQSSPGQIIIFLIKHTWILKW